MICSKAEALLKVEVIRTSAELALQRVGVPGKNAALQVDLLLEAELRGHPSHGLLRLPRLVERINNGVASGTATGVHEWRSSSLLDVDGEMGLGPVVAMKALNEAARRAKETGVAVVAIRNNNHLGMLAWYADRIASRGQVFLGLSTSEALVHAWGGRSAILGTNPIAIGVPTAREPFVLDMATSLVSMGQILDYAQRDQPIPEGWAVDANGDPTTDAVAAKSGAIAPFGDAKGYALGLAIEILIVSLTNSAIGRDVTGTLDSTTVCNKGDLFVVIDLAIGKDLAARISQYLDAVRSSGDKVAVPGDRARETRQQKLAGGVLLPQELWDRLCNLAVATHQH
ncbi:Ldh family oxidoreductase [Bradyrhizobium sp. INPA03-11B]|uniref:Ldh family oxidoreductase n=1 Tax=Bradyrhizobium sp. INPA03-11B TaxID=418598 RepID=UPI00338E8B93